MSDTLAHALINGIINQLPRSERRRVFDVAVHKLKEMRPLDPETIDEALESLVEIRKKFQEGKEK